MISDDSPRRQFARDGAESREGPWNATARAALAFLAEQSRHGFPDAMHSLPFPRAQGFDAAEDVQHGDVFSRALIADALLDARDGGAAVEPIIAGEVDHLLRQRRSDGVGGWAYFPRLPELPPDCDDLAQVMQVLLRSGRTDALAAYCETSLSLLAERRGRFSTWIVPEHGRSPIEDRQADWIAAAWGDTEDAEVIANLLYALRLYDAGRFARSIHDGAHALCRMQCGDGSWRAGWYHGPFYGTYAVLRLYRAIGATGVPIARAAAFLRRAQRDDGGWGLAEEPSDPLNTSLALLALRYAGEPLDLPSLLTGDDPEWPDVPFIRMELGRAGGGVRNVLTFGSPSITAAFALKAALAQGGIFPEDERHVC